MRPSLFLKIFAAFLTANLLAMTLAVYYLMPPSESKEFYEIRKEFSLNMAKTIIGRFEANKPLNIFQSDLYGLNRPMRSRFLTEKFVILDERNKVIFGEQDLHTDDQHSFLDYQSDSSRQYRIVIGDSREPSVLNYFIKQRQTVRFAILFVATVIVSFIVSLLIIRPLKQLGKHARSLSEGNLHSRVEHRLLTRNDEIGDLSRELNEMANTLDSLINSKQQLLHDVSHELRAPLSRLQAIAAIMHQKKTIGSKYATVERIERECTRMNELIQELLKYSRLHYDLDNNEAPSLIKISALIKNIVINIQDEYPTHTIQLNLLDEDVSIIGHIGMLERAFENILRNACKHTPDQTSIDICVQQINEKVEIQIRDHGPGIKDKDLSFLATPFFRGDGVNPKAGYGLGLSISQRIIKHYRGTMNISNYPKQGLLITAIFPAVNS